MRINSGLFLLSVWALLVSCGEKNSPEEPKNPEPLIAKAWVTNGYQSKLLSEEKNISLSDLNVNTVGLRITPGSGQPMQEMDGFGAALTGSSAYLIHKKLNSTQRETLLKELFSTDNGIGISYIRITMGASDFSLEDFTYNDIESGSTDPQLLKFSIAKEKEDLIPVLKQIISISPNIKIMASPWTAPAWMKTNGKIAGGKLKPEWYNAYAQYFVKYIKAFEQEGVKIESISVQNEPLHEATYPSMRMDAVEQIDFIKNHLGPAFEKEGIKTKILGYDHNWDRTDYPLQVLGDASAKKYISGTAFHAYAGDATAMSNVHNTHPDKGIYFTEISGGEWSTDFGNNLAWNMKNIFIGSARNWSKNALLWNLALDENHGPKNGGCQDCRGVVTINSDGSYVKNVEFYSIGHMSKFIKPGAKRYLTKQIEEIEQVSFLNPDGSLVVIVLNDSQQSKRIIVEWGQKQISYNQEPRSVISYIISK